jgi:hypothetical protein
MEREDMHSRILLQTVDGTTNEALTAFPKRSLNRLTLSLIQ